MPIARIVAELPGKLTEAEIVFWRRLTFGESPRDIGKAMGLDRADTLVVQQSVLDKLGVCQLIDAVREGIYAGF